MPRHFQALIAIVVLALFVLPGCGGDDDGGSASGGSTVASSDTGGESDEGGSSEEDGGSESDAAGEEGEDASGAQTGPNAEFVEEANAICTKNSEKLQNEMKVFLAQNVNKDETKALEDLTHNVVLPSLEREIKAIRALGLPAGEEEQVEAILTGMEGVLDKASANPSGFAEIKSPFAKPEKLADDYGLPECGGL